MNQADIIREIHERYQQSGRLLNERQRRLWAATEAINLGRGGITIVSKALRISPNTIKRGIQEIETGQADASLNATARIRKSGGGRKPQQVTSESLPTMTVNEDAAASLPIISEPSAGVQEAKPRRRPGND